MKGLKASVLFMLLFSSSTVQADIIRVFDPAFYGNAEFRVHTRPLDPTQRLNIEDNVMGQIEFYYRFFNDEPFGVSGHMLTGNWLGHKFVEAYAGPMAKFGPIATGLSVGASNDERREEKHLRLATWFHLTTKQLRLYTAVSMNQEGFYDDHTYTWYDLQLQYWGLDWLGVEIRMNRDPGLSANIHLKWKIVTLWGGYSFYNPHRTNPHYPNGTVIGMRIDY